MLKIGTWRILTENPQPSGWQENHVSEPFTVIPCAPGECVTSTGWQDAQTAKDAAREAMRFASNLCTAMGVWDKISTAAAGAARLNKLAGSSRKTMIMVSRHTDGAVRVFLVSAGEQLDLSDLEDFAPNPYEWLLEGLSCAVRQMHQDILEDPPDYDYQTVQEPTFEPIPAGAPSAAIHEYLEAMSYQYGYAEALLAAFERYQGAEDDGNFAAALLQIGAVARFGKALQAAMLDSANAAEQLAESGEAASVQVTSRVPFSAGENHDSYREFAQRLREDGLTPEENNLLVDAGLSPEEVAYLVSTWADFDPQIVQVGESIGGLLASQADHLRQAAYQYEDFSRTAAAVEQGLGDMLADDTALVDRIALEVKSLSGQDLEKNNTLRIGETFCVTSEAFDGEGNALRGVVADFSTSGVVEWEAKNSRWVFITPQCVFSTIPGSLTFDVNVGDHHASATVNWRASTAEDHTPWAQATSVEVAPEGSVEVTLQGGDDSGHPVEFEIFQATTEGIGTLTGTPPNLTFTAAEDARGRVARIPFTVSDGEKIARSDAFVVVTATPGAAGDRLVNVLGEIQHYDPRWETAVPGHLQDAEIVSLAGSGVRGAFALTSDGRVTAWASEVSGGESSGVWQLPEWLPQGKIRQIDALTSQYMAYIDEDGRAGQWGQYGNRLPHSLTDTPIKDIRTFYYGGIALLEDDSLRVWQTSSGVPCDLQQGCEGGDITGSLTIAPGPYRDITAVESGARDTVAALTADGVVYEWGIEHTAGTEMKASVPSDPIVSISSRREAILGLTASGNLVGWGWEGVQPESAAEGLRRVVEGPGIREIAKGDGYGHGLVVVTRDGELRSVASEYTEGIYRPRPVYIFPVPAQSIGREALKVSQGYLGGLVALGEPLSSPDPDPEPEPEPEWRVVRHAGVSRYETAVAISEEGFPRGAPVVYLATGANYPDALGAAPAAAKEGGPLLLTGKSKLPVAVRAELSRLDPDRVVIVGGTGAVTPAVAAEVKSLLGTVAVERVGGADRYETANLIVDRLWGRSGSDSVYLATGRDFPDALSASPAAAAVGGPVLLTNGKAKALSPQTAALLRKIRVKNINVVGGTGAVSAQIERSLRADTGASMVRRLAGNNRYETSIAINRFAFKESDELFLATGTGFADALSGGALAAKREAPLYVISPRCVPQAVAHDAVTLRATTARVLGGTGALHAPVEQWRTC